MPDHVVDTNVLLVASAAHPSSPFDDSHVPFEQQLQVLDWLMTFNDDDSRRLVLDDEGAILSEYRHKLNEQDVGFQVIREKIQGHRRAMITMDEAGHAVVPADLQVCDPSDRKFLAAALTDAAGISIVNATDSDWVKIEAALKAAGVVVDNVIESWLRAWMTRRER